MIRSHPQQPHRQLGREQRPACALPSWLSSTPLHRAPVVRSAPIHCQVIVAAPEDEGSQVDILHLLRDRIAARLDEGDAGVLPPCSR